MEDTLPPIFYGKIEVTGLGELTVTKGKFTLGFRNRVECTNLQGDWSSL